MNTVLDPAVPPVAPNSTPSGTFPVPGLATLLWRGFRKSCPRCGKGRLFRKFLKATENCASCQQHLGDIRADDFPPYLTMVVVGHIIVPLILFTEREFQPSITLHLSVWLPATAVLAFWFLPRLKGMIIGLMLHLGLRGDERQ
ncbi:DUF983 domain-containing protein [Thalassospiraceae bacterium LMO-JJ14]|nr:DUF983 domain-containing protein [Thalassospiraceae bacterium LMO-JJ14]